MNTNELLKSGGLLFFKNDNSMYNTMYNTIMDKLNAHWGKKDE